MTNAETPQEVRFEDQPTQGFYGHAATVKIRTLHRVYLQRLMGVTFQERVWPAGWFWKKVWAQGERCWTYPKGTTKLYAHSAGVMPAGETIGNVTIAQSFQGLTLERYDFVYFMRRPGKIITEKWLRHLLAEEGWRLE